MCTFPLLFLFNKELPYTKEFKNRYQFPHFFNVSFYYLHLYHQINPKNREILQKRLSSHDIKLTNKIKALVKEDIKEIQVK